jgi:hypothetical protein
MHAVSAPGSQTDNTFMLLADCLHTGAAALDQESNAAQLLIMHNLSVGRSHLMLLFAAHRNLFGRQGTAAATADRGGAAVAATAWPGSWLLVADIVCAGLLETKLLYQAMSGCLSAYAACARQQLLP